MWISEKLAAINNSRQADDGIVQQSADRRVSAAAEDGTAQYSLAGVPGIIYKPQPDDQAVLIKTSGGAVCIGIRLNPYTDTIQPGELILKSAGGAVLKLANDGCVYINGREIE